MNLGSSRRLLAAALVLPLGLFACGESAAPGASTGTAPTAAPSASAATAPTLAPSADVTATATATAEPTPPATATATALAPATASAKPTATASAKPTAKPATSATTSAAPADTTAATATPSGTATASAAPIAAPAEGSADAIAQKIDAIFSPKKNFSAKFKQKLEQKVSGAKKEASGTLTVERPNKISFRYDPPNKNRVVADGTTLKIYMAEDAQMFTSKVDSSAYAGGLAFLMGGLLKTMSFTFNTKADYKDGYVLIGKPRVPGPNYEYVIFYVSRALLEKGEPGVIERIVIVDAQGNKNRFDFTDSSFPASVLATEWEFTPPPGTNIVK